MGAAGRAHRDGEPGIDKSALAGAATAHGPRRAAGCPGGAGGELGQALPLLPFLDGLRVREPPQTLAFQTL